MSEYISKNEACQELREARCCDMTDKWGQGYNAGITEAIDRINNIPPADVTPVVHGHWIYGEDELGQDGYSCSECDFFVPWFYKYYEEGLHFIKDYHRCPQCGAKMDKEASGNE